jgi:hypothetical protein
MIPKTINPASLNPGLPGFARFWGYQNSCFGSLAGLGRIDVHGVGEGRLSCRKVCGAGASDPLPEEHSLVTSRAGEKITAFLQESFSEDRLEQLLREQNAQREEGSSMPGIQ